MHDVLHTRNSCALDMLASDQVHVQSDTGTADHIATYIHICRPSSGQRSGWSAASQLLAASVPYCIERSGRAARFLPLATYMYVT